METGQGYIYLYGNARIQVGSTSLILVRNDEIRKLSSEKKIVFFFVVDLKS